MKESKHWVCDTLGEAQANLHSFATNLMHGVVEVRSYKRFTQYYDILSSAGSMCVQALKVHGS